MMMKSAYKQKIIFMTGSEATENILCNKVEKTFFISLFRRDVSDKECEVLF